VAALNTLVHLLLWSRRIAGLRVDMVLTNIINELNSTIRPGERLIALGGGNPLKERVSAGRAIEPRRCRRCRSGYYPETCRPQSLRWWFPHSANRR
jgi:hypothetical protein